MTRNPMIRRSDLTAGPPTYTPVLHVQLCATVCSCVLLLLLLLLLGAETHTAWALISVMHTINTHSDSFLR